MTTSIDPSPLSLLAPAFEVEVVEFMEPLLVFADGVKLRLRYRGLEFTANYCSYSAMEFELGRPQRPIEDRQQIYRTAFPPGRALTVQAYLDDCSAPKGRNVKKLPQPSSRSVVDYTQLDWRVVGEVVGGPIDDDLLVDCGIPILTFAHPDLRVGDWGEWLGELRLWDYDPANP